MSETPDYTEAGELYRKSMEQALVNIDKVNEDLLRQQEKAIDEQIAARELRNQIERDAHKISEDYIDKHRKEFENRLRNEILLDVVKKLIKAEIPSLTLKQNLELTPELLTEAWMDLGFDKLGEQHIGHVGYENYGKAGFVIFYREDLTIRFPCEFGEGLTLSIIDIPTPEQWENKTGTALDDRQIILEFVARRILRDQAEGYHHRITDDAIYIELK
jgi:hypothetical protein